MYIYTSMIWTLLRKNQKDENVWGKAHPLVVEYYSMVRKSTFIVSISLRSYYYKLGHDSL